MAYEIKPKSQPVSASKLQNGNRNLRTVSHKQSARLQAIAAQIIFLYFASSLYVSPLAAVGGMPLATYSLALHEELIFAQTCS